MKSAILLAKKAGFDKWLNLDEQMVIDRFSRFAKLFSEEYKHCSLCNGSKGGVAGNNQIINGVAICDYCHSDGSVDIYNKLDKILDDALVHKDVSKIYSDVCILRNQYLPKDSKS